MTYNIEASKNGKHWVHHASFVKGQRSRFNDAPFDETIAVREAECFRDAWREDGWIYVRVVIEL